MGLNIIVDSIEKKESPKTKTKYVLITDRQGGMYSAWDDPKKYPGIYDDALELEPNMVINISYDTVGTFKNVTKIIFMEEYSSREIKVPALEKTNNGSSFNDRKDLRISRLACINSSIEFHKLKAGSNPATVSEQMILETADKFEQHVYRGMKND